MTKRWFTMLILIGIAGGVGYLILSRSYPVVLVNGQTISAGDFRQYYSGAYKYYQNMLELYTKDTAVLNAEETKKEIERAILGRLIEDKLIDEELNKIMSAADLDRIVEEKISKIDINNEKLNKGVGILYGFSVDEFKKRVLVPQAKGDILKDRIFLENGNFDEKLKELKRNAKVTILIPGFSWTGEDIAVK